jgi:biopolymer transport protein ExbD
MAGGSSARTNDGQKKARIEIIPLIDVIFFLLATFVLFTLSLNKLSSLPIQLPAAGYTPQIEQIDKPIILQVSDEGNCYWNSELIGVTEVPARLQTYRQNSPNPRVMIAGDINARFGTAIRMLDEVKKFGITQVSIETQVRPTGK